jgi:hypothetical protein
MNEQLPPIDPILREHLSRRTSSSMPSDLLPDIYAALDAASTEKERVRAAGPVWRAPRALLAGVAMAAAAALIAAVMINPRTNPGPAAQFEGYPAERALTTAELATVMAGPALANNTAIVATVTIQNRNDVCPMNRWPTLGVVEGMAAQVCVMGSGVADYLASPSASGTFAFRYLWPGYLGLIGEVESAGARLSFGVADQWPTDGKSFVVDGWLGQTPTACSTEELQSADVLLPSGWDPCASSWMTGDGSPGAAAVASDDALALHGNYRIVMAGGVRQIDDLPTATTHGYYVVKPTMGPCPGASPIDSRGCTTWLVTARLAEGSLPLATATPASTPTAAYQDTSKDPVLSTDELSALMSTTALPWNSALLASVQVDPGTDGCPITSYQIVGSVRGIEPKLCVEGPSPIIGQARDDHPDSRQRRRPEGDLAQDQEMPEARRRAVLLARLLDCL